MGEHAQWQEADERLMGPEFEAQHDYADMSHRASLYHDRLQHARSIGDTDGAHEAERLMNESLDSLQAILRTLGDTAIGR